MTAVVSMRLHGLIFASGHGIPLVGVSYDPKVAAFLNFIGQRLYVDLEDVEPNKLCDLITSAVMSAAEKKHLAERTLHLIEMEKTNSECARRLLSED